MRDSALAGEYPVRSDSVRTALGPAKEEGEI